MPAHVGCRWQLGNYGGFLVLALCGCRANSRTALSASIFQSSSGT